VGRAEAVRGAAAAWRDRSGGSGGKERRLERIYIPIGTESRDEFAGSSGGAGARRGGFRAIAEIAKGSGTNW